VEDMVLAMKNVYEEGEKPKFYRKKPVVGVGSDPMKIRAYSESELMRFNYYGW
jgi:hypothetical protein